MVRDPYAWWCGRRDAVRHFPIPIILHNNQRCAYMNKGKSIVFLTVWFLWASGQDLDSIARYSIKSDFYVFSSNNIAPVFFIFAFLVFILNIATVYYLFKPSHLGFKTALSALGLSVIQNTVSLFLALNDISGVREAYSKGREIRGLSIREEALDMIFTPSALYSGIGVMLFLYFFVAFFVVRNRYYFYESTLKV